MFYRELTNSLRNQEFLLIAIFIQNPKSVQSTYLDFKFALMEMFLNLRHSLPIYKIEHFPGPFKKEFPITNLNRD